MAAVALALVLATSGPKVARAQAPAADPAASLQVQAGQSATELAMDHVPPGTTIEQFLLALWRLNPLAFQGGDLNRLQAGAVLRLPTAKEANAMPPEQAREQLAGLRHAPSTPSALAAVPDAQARQALAPVAAPDASAAQAAPTQPVPAAVAASAPATGLAVPALAAAVLALLAWLWRRQSAATAAKPKAQPASVGPEEQAQGRFQPVLPGERPAPAVPPPASQPPVAKPALFDLDLNLDGPAPPLDLPEPVRPTAVKHAGPRPLDLGSVSLDLDSPPRKASAPGPLDLSGLSLDLDPTPAKDLKDAP